MVRLKDGLVPNLAAFLLPFQFLNGAIKRNSFYGEEPDNILFQFLNGAIKSDSLGRAVQDLILFQFLNGAIKSQNPVRFF